jgi:4-hydroxy-tetrahydrodipicolinate reductase
MNLLVNGALGRMGRRIIALAAEDPEITVAGAVDSGNPDLLGRDIGDIIGLGPLGTPVTGDLAGAIAGCDVVVDFTFPEAILSTAKTCANARIPLVVGTTGLPKDLLPEFKHLVTPIPCVMTPNMSVGMNLLFRLAAEAAAILGDMYDVEITEAHHRFKKDAPSGTAIRLAEVIAEALGRNLDTDAVYGRRGITGERSRREIGIHALRVGDVVGEHTVTFGTIGERIELTHRAQSRDALAKGALRAAKFVVGAKPGLYDMLDVLGLR